MATQKPKTTAGEIHPSGDERYLSLDRTMKQFNFEKDSLLEVLNAAQEVFGYLSRDLLIYISNQLDVPMSQVYGVATFYHLFTFEPQGVHNCIICKGTACHVKGADRLIEAISKEFSIAAGETTPDGLFSLTIARCLGSCGLAPVIVFDGQVYGKETPEAVNKRVLEAVSRSKEELAHPVEVG
jgi:bidirectional [NiFe] hydrogenase diaphorase subunit